MIGTLTDTATSLSAASTELAASSGSSGQQAEAVAAGADQLSVSINEISRSINEASAIVADAVRTADSTTEAVQALGTSSREIGDVLGIISEIASKTDLLALNALIEAARAGEAGRGFAVVANEVQALARRTKGATETIREKITSIQRDVERSSTSIAAIAASVERISQMQGLIAAAVTEQSATSDEIAGSVGAVAASARETKQVASTVAEMASALERGIENLNVLFAE